MRLLSIFFLICWPAWALADLDAAVDAFNSEDYAGALKAAEAAQAQDLNAEDAALAEELRIAAAYFQGRRDRALRDDAIAADRVNAAVFGQDAIERLQLLFVLSDLEFELGRLEEALRADVLIMRIAWKHPDQTTEDLIWTARNIAIAFDTETSDIRSAVIFAALFEFLAVDLLGHDDPLAQEATAMYANALLRAGADTRAAQRFFLYSVESWEAFARLGPDEDDLIARLWNGLDSLPIADQDAWLARVQDEHDAYLAREMLSAEIGELVAQGELRFASPFYAEALAKMNLYLDIAHPEDPVTASYLNMILRNHLAVDDYAGARAYLGGLLAYPLEFIAALDLPLGQLAGTFAVRGGADDAVIEPLLRTAQDLDALVPSGDPDLAFDLAFALGQIAERQERFEDAVRAYRTAVTVAEKGGVRSHVVPRAADGASRISLVLGRFDDALTFGTLMLDQAQAAADDQAISTAYTNLFLANEGLGRSDIARDWVRAKLTFEQAREPIDAQSLRVAEILLAVDLLRVEGVTDDLIAVMLRIFASGPFDEDEAVLRDSLLAVFAQSLDVTPDTLPGHAFFVSASPAARADLIVLLTRLASQSGDYEMALKWNLFGRQHVPEDAPGHFELRELEGVVALWLEEPALALQAFRAVSDYRLADARAHYPDATTHLAYHIASAAQLSGAAPKSIGQDDVFHNEVFLMAQRAGTTRAGQALNSALIRDQSDSALRNKLKARQQIDEALAQIQDAIARATFDGRETTEQRARQEELSTQRDALSADIADVAPALAQITDFAPLPLRNVADTLKDGEVMLLYATSDQSVPGQGAPSYVVALDKWRTKIAPLQPRAALQTMADQLRCAAALTDLSCGNSGATATRGRFDLGGAANPHGPAFDAGLAHEAYQMFLAPIADMLEGKSNLVVVPDQALSTLPIHLVLTAPLAPGQSLSNAPWLIRDMAVEIAPTVASFAASRSDAPTLASTSPSFLGVGDPLIGVQKSGPVDFVCGQAPLSLTLSAVVPPELQRASGAVRSGIVADLSALPDTRCELARMADRFETHTVLLHENATEARLKAMNADGSLRRASVLNFATHGLIAGEIGVNEAGLVLTPPTVATSKDDGLLTTAEIVDLDLNAEFVILSACNTASGDSRNSEALSGLASAFFLAGAKSLLVSHWPVYSDAAVHLTTRTFDVMAAEPDIGRAQAVRLAMLSVLDDPDATARMLHPGYWGPFMLVGGGV